VNDSKNTWDVVPKNKKIKKYLSFQTELWRLSRSEPLSTTQYGIAIQYGSGSILPESVAAYHMLSFVIIELRRTNCKDD
jgi:hypothetical protein